MNKYGANPNGHHFNKKLAFNPSLTSPQFLFIPLLLYNGIESWSHDRKQTFLR